MALGTRQVLLLLRANDQASRIVQRTGAAVGTLSVFGHRAQNAFADLDAQASRTFGPQMYQRLNLSAQQVGAVGLAATGVGLAMTAVGAIGISWLAGAIDQSIKYRQQVALTLTQVHQFESSLSEVGEVGRRVAQQVAVPFEELQPALYDIFSTLDKRFIPSMREAEDLLVKMAKAAVAGQTDIRTVTRLTIDIMNNFKVGVDEVDQVLDVLFQLVRTGKGDFNELARSFSLNASSALKAGASLDEFTGTFAFLSRILPTAARTSASVGRAFDLMANPKFAEHLHDIGIEVADLQGNFKPFPQLMREIAVAFKSMTEVERAEALSALTKGAGGTIQALRGVFSALKDPDGLIAAVDETAKASGVFEEMYGVMADTPEAKIQMLKNAIWAFKTALGDALLPIVTVLIEKLTGLVNWFNRLSPTTKKVIAITLAVVSVLLVLTGVVVTLAGVFLILASAIMLATGLTLPALLAAAAPVALVIAGIAAAVMAVVGAFILFKTFTGKIKGSMGYVAAAVGGFLTKLGLIPIAILAVIRNFDKIKRFFTDTLPNAVGIAAGVIGRFFTQTIPQWFKNIGTFFKDMWKTWFDPDITSTGLFGFMERVVSGIRHAWDSLFAFIVSIPSRIVSIVGTIVSFFASLPGTVAGYIGDMIMRIATALGAAPTSIANALGYIVGFIVGFFVTLPKRIYDIFVKVHDVLTDWGIQAASWAGRTGLAIINAIIRFIASLPGRIAGFFTTIWNGLVSWGGKAVSWAGRTASNIVSAIVRFLSTLPGKVAGFFARVYNAVVSWLSKLPGQAAKFGQGIWSGLWNAIKSLPGMVGNIFSQVVEVIKGWIGRAIRAAADFASGIWNGIKNAIMGSPHTKIEYLFWDIEANVLDVLNHLKREGPRIAGQIGRGIDSAFGTFPSLTGDVGGALDFSRGNTATTIVDTHDEELIQELRVMRELLAAVLARNPEFVLEMDKHILGKILEKREKHNTRAKK